MEDEEGAELGATFLSCLVEWREVPAISGIHQTVVLDQHGCHINMLQAYKTKIEVRIWDS